jgi:hypothetical protein
VAATAEINPFVARVGNEQLLHLSRRQH